MTNQLLTGRMKRREAAQGACSSAAQDQLFTAATQLFSGSPVHHRGVLWTALLALFGPPQRGTKQETLGGKLVVRTHMAGVIPWVSASEIPGMG